MAGDQTANFVVKAKDQASGPLGKIGTSMGKLKKSGINAFKAIGAASAVAVGAITAVAVDAITKAASDERQTILLNSALKQRGLYTDDLNAKIQAQILSMGALGIVDDQVRAGLEVGSRFFKNQEQLLKANSVAADIAAVTGTDLAEAVMAIGKASRGQTRGLKELGITVKKGATIQDILNAATKKYGGIATELANSTSGKFAKAQVTFNETLESLGYKLLPKVNDVLDWVSKTGMPAFQEIVGKLGPIIINFIDTAVAPLVNSLNELFTALGGLDTLGSLLELAFQPFIAALNVIKFIIDAIIAGLKLIGVIAPGTASSIHPMTDKYSHAGAFGGGQINPGYANTTNVFIGNDKVDTVVSKSVKRMVKNGRYQ